MKLLKDLYDDEYQKQGFTHTRNTARAILLNDKNEIGMLYLKGEDEFGKRKHYESPGGKIEENENEIEALKRELLEETGYVVEVLEPLGMIVSRYNLLKRITVSRYYICSILDKEKLHRTDEENILIDSVVFKSLERWLKVFQTGKNPVDRLVHKRELIALNRFKALYNKQ